MGPAWLGLLDDIAARRGTQGVASWEYYFVETDVSVKSTTACIGIAGVVGASSRQDAEVTTACEDKDSAS